MFVQLVVATPQRLSPAGQVILTVWLAPYEPALPV
jgi:hypothetical protein